LCIGLDPRKMGLCRSRCAIRLYFRKSECLFGIKKLITHNYVHNTLVKSSAILDERFESSPFTCIIVKHGEVKCDVLSCTDGSRTVALDSAY
jgi:hypothetical protein